MAWRWSRPEDTRWSARFETTRIADHRPGVVEIAIPTLETERLILRPFREEDAALFCEYLQDPDVNRFVGEGQAPSAEDCWRAVAGWIGHWVMRDYGPWAVTEKATGTFMGRTGIHFPESWPQPELAYTFGKPFWGKGYATEAVRAAMDWGFTERDFPELCSLIDPLNERSMAVATRVGETYRRDGALRGHPLRVYVITRAEWEAQRAQA
jgi:RimJ/RimL family protein N-acetyltransferase